MPIFRQIQASWFGADPVSSPPSTGTPSEAVDPAPQRVTGRAPVHRTPSGSTGRAPERRRPCPVLLRRCPVLLPVVAAPVVPAAPAGPSCRLPARGRPRSCRMRLRGRSCRAPASAPAQVPTRAFHGSARRPWTSSPARAAAESAGRSPAPVEEEWQSTADSGWQAAAAAAQTRRVRDDALGTAHPHTPGQPRPRQRVRGRTRPRAAYARTSSGLLSAYTRGVQRGRDDLRDHRTK